MSKTLRWVLTLLPCAPGITLLLAGAAVAVAGRGERDAWRIPPLLTAGGAVLLVGLAIGAFVAWRIAHPRPNDAEEDGRTPPAAD